MGETMLWHFLVMPSCSLMARLLCLCCVVTMSQRCQNVFEALPYFLDNIPSMHNGIRLPYQLEESVQI